MPILGKRHEAASSSGRDRSVPFCAKISSPGTCPAAVETIKLVRSGTLWFFNRRRSRMRRASPSLQGIDSAEPPSSLSQTKEQRAMASSQVGIATPGITQLLQAWTKGDEGALEQLAPLVERELYRLARKYLRRERAHRPLETTELVNEVYLRI